MSRIEGLDLRDHVTLVMGRRSLRLSVFLSVVAILLSTASLVAKVFKLGDG